MMKMDKTKVFQTVIMATLMLAAGASLLMVPAAARGAASVGVVDFQISCAADSRDDFNHALALTHHMMYGQARAVFEAIVEKEPTCAMAYWGVAMTLFHPLWAPPGAEELKLGAEAMSRAVSLTLPTARERAHIMAAKAFYENWETVGHRDRIAAWKDAQEELYRIYPGDPDATAFYALALLAAAPKDDTAFGEQKKAGMILEDLHAGAPEHPAGFHYLIHAYDNPLLAEKAVGIARAYDGIAPDVPHALHMPTHIFVRLGLWADVVDWNERSAAAALTYPAGGATSLHYAHAMDYLVYGNLQIGEDEKALAALKTMNEFRDYQDSFASAYALAAAGGRYALERSQWDEAARFSLDTVPGVPWEKYPQFEAIAWFTRGLGAAVSGDLAGAEDARMKLEILHGQTSRNGQTYWATIVESQQKTVAAWIAFGKGDGEAIAKMRLSADLEDSVDKHPVTPGAVLPARELLGDMLFLEKKYTEALEAYEASLKISANRFRSLYGAARAAELAGLNDTAREYYRELLDSAGGDGVNRPEVRQARAYLRNI
jgi:tetratricopeptide (TPR) repeat protein